MNRPTFFALIALNALLAFVLAGEWYAERETSAIVQSQSKNLETQTEELPSLDLSASSEDSYSDLIERPLFIKGRKPVAEPEPETVPVAAVKKVEAFVWELTGIFVTPKGVTAFFSRTGAKMPKDNYRKQKIGDDIDGWKLSEIHPENVTLSQAGETKVLPLRKMKPKTPLPEQMNATHRIPSQQPRMQPPVPPSQAMQQQTIQKQDVSSQNLQSPEIEQNVEQPADESNVDAVTQ